MSQSNAPEWLRNNNCLCILHVVRCKWVANALHLRWSGLELLMSKRDFSKKHYYGILWIKKMLFPSDSFPDCRLTTILHSLIAGLVWQGAGYIQPYMAASSGRQSGGRVSEISSAGGPAEMPKGCGYNVPNMGTSQSTRVGKQPDCAELINLTSFLFNVLAQNEILL